MKKIAVCFGGISPEHEVSIITGLQVIENIDTTSFAVYPIYVSKEGEFFYLPQVMSRNDFLTSSKNPITFGRDNKGGYFQSSGLLGRKIYLDASYLAFHGGNGESGPIQGLFDTCGIPYTGQSVFTSCVSMNKQVTKELVASLGVPTIPGLSFSTADIKMNTKAIVSKVSKKLGLPVIVKPVHLGSSIGVVVCESEVALTKALLSSAHIDEEVVVEKLMKNFVEYNVAVRSIKGIPEVSEIEKPIKKDEILSFADKYERGGGKKSGGMASLVRELPAKISSALKKQIQEYALNTYTALRATGMLRCDFMYANKKLYLVEVNPIPGSMSFYLWEASGISFSDQITSSLEEALFVSEKSRSMRLTYDTDIVKSFVKAK